MLEVFWKLGERIFKRDKSKKSLYCDLAPDDSLKNNVEYFSALKWALENPKIKNIAISGPYGAGKSSIIQSFVKKYPKYKYINISLANFAKNDQGELVELEETDVEKGILKQFFYKVKQDKIPQSRYRKLKVINHWRIAGGTLLAALLTALGFTFLIPSLKEHVGAFLQNAVDNLGISNKEAMVLGIVIVLAALLFIAHIIWRVASTFRIKEINFSEKAGANAATTASDEEAIFNREMDEIVYFFEATGYNVVFIEDLDRFNNIEIFVKLRELNTILNSYDALKKKIVFVYAVRDDMFTSLERTKFFEYILPVIPIINSTNSGEKLLERVSKDRESGFNIELSDEYITLISPYISDMRVLNNTYNEFITYKKVLITEQGLKLSDEIMFSIMVFKNAYPKEFAELQDERGIVKEAFESKRTKIRELKAEIEEKRDALITKLQNIDAEVLDEQRDVKAAMLAFMTGYKGAFSSFYSGSSNDYYNDIMSEDYDLERLRKRGTVYYNDGYSRNLSFDGMASFVGSKDYIRKYNEIIPEKRAEYQQQIDEFDAELLKLSSVSMKGLLSMYEASKLFSESIQENKLLVFLLRQGYINEEYQTYVNYFHANSITTDDKNFILSVRNHEALEYSYSLTKVKQVMQGLLPDEFQQKEIYNFDLLDYLISDEGDKEKLNILITQLSDENEISTRFIHEYFNATQNQQQFIVLLCKEWSGFWDHIEKNVALIAGRKDRYLAAMIENTPSIDLECQNAKGNIKKYFEENPDILRRLSDVSLEKMKSVINLCEIMFAQLEIDEVSSELLDWIFDHGYYQITFEMLQSIFMHKSPNNVSKLATQNYTMIRELGDSSLLEYIDEDFEKYVTSIVLEIDSNTEESLDTVLYIIENPHIHISLADEVIIKENVMLDSLSRCSFEKFSKDEQQHLWNRWISTNKLNPTWENVMLYWENYGITDELLELVLKVEEDCPQDMDGELVMEIICSDLEKSCFERLIGKMPRINLGLDYSNINSEHMKVLLRHRYFDFTAEVASAIKQNHPQLNVMAIAIYKEEVKLNIPSFAFDLEEIERIIASKEFAENEKVRFIEESSLAAFSEKIAQFLSKTTVVVKKYTFDKAWVHLNQVQKRELFFHQLEGLDNDVLERCFANMGKEYQEFADRSRRHDVKLIKSPENQKLADYMKRKAYITSFSEEHGKIKCTVKKEVSV